MPNESIYRWPLILAVGLHVILFILLFWHLTSADTQQLQAQPDVNIIKAVAVSPSTLAKISEQLEQQRQAELAQQQAIKLAQEKAIQQKAAAEAAKQAAAQKAAAEAAKQLAAQKAAAEAAKQAAVQKAAQQVAAQKAAVEVAKQAAAQKAATEAAQQQAAKVATQKAAQEKAQQAQKQQQAAKQKAAQQKEMDAEIAQEQKQLTAARTAQQQTEIEKYKALIEQAISQNWLVPGAANPDLSCQLLIEVGPGGVVLNVQVARSSGDSGLDNSARTAVFKASPLPMPSDPDLFNQFRQMKLTVKPENIN